MSGVNDFVKSTYKRFKIMYMNNPAKIKIYVIVVVVILVLLYMLFSTYLKNKEMEKMSMSNFGSYAAKKASGENKKDNKTHSENNINGGGTQNGSDDKAMVVVDIGGQVKAPGVYRLKKGSRINDVIEKAGGLSDKGDVNKINRAEEISDGEKIYIPAYGEEANENSGNLVTDYSDVGEDKKIVVNINKATAVELEKIPGVGPSMAKKIIDHRVSNGKFRSVDDLKNVSGIGDKTFEKMRPYITI